MLLSSSFCELDLERAAIPEHGVQDVDPASGEREDGLVVAFAFGSFAVVEGAAGGVAERAERGLVEDAFEGLVGSASSLEIADLSGLFEDRCEAGGGGEVVWGGEAGEVACLGDEFGGEGGPHPGQAADEGRVRVALQRRLEFAVQEGEAFAELAQFERELADEFGCDAFAGDGEALGSAGGERGVGELLDMPPREPAGARE